jgi:hypothetical protein
MSYALQFTPTNKNNDIKTAVATSSYYDVNWIVGVVEHSASGASIGLHFQAHQ